MPQKEGRDEAIRIAKDALAESIRADPGGFDRRCERLGLPPPSGGDVEFGLFGNPARFDAASLELTDLYGAPRSQSDQILFYHYFVFDGALAPGGDPVSFRDFPGGSFYWEPFRARGCLPLARRYSNDFPGLRAALDRFNWTELALGDFSARIHGFGHLYLTLVAHAACEGLGAELGVLFDPAVRRVFRAEDAVAFASRICLSLL